MTATSKRKNAMTGSAWARPIETLHVAEMPAEAVNLNVEGRRLIGPLNGFGQLWQKTYSVRLSGASVKPAELIRTWKERFPTFWPVGNYFFAPLTGIAPGEVAVLNLAAPANLKLSTGVLVIYADETSFSFMNPQGHIFAGLITFSAHEEEGATVAQIQPLIRTSDPLYELGYRLGVVGWIEDKFWHATLQNLAATFGVSGLVTQKTMLIDPRLQWTEAKNIWYNAGIRSVLYKLAAPVRWLLQVGK